MHVSAVRDPDPGAYTPTTFDHLSSDQDRAKVWTELQLLLQGKCVTQSGSSVKLDDFNNGNWWIGGTPAVGHHVEPDDGKVDCNNGASWFTPLASVAGYNSWTDLGNAAGGNYDHENAWHNITPQNVGKVLANAIFSTSNPFTPGWSAPVMPGWMPYWIAQYHLFNVCNAKEAPAVGTDEYNKYESQHASFAKINVYDSSTGGVVSKDIVYGYDGAKDAGSSITIGFGITGVGNGSGAAQCNTMADFLTSKDPATRMQEWVDFSVGNNLNNGAGGDSGGVTAATTTPSCENTGFSLAWFMCPVIDGLADSVDQLLNKLIVPMLKTPQINDTSDPSQHLKAAWSSFRVIADIILVIALLVIVFGESIGGGLIEAYTAKKVLPRILIAAILINTSYYLMAAALDITNVIGGGIGELITAPFGLKNGAGNFKFDLSGQGSGQGSFQLLVVGIGGAAGVAKIFKVIEAATGPERASIGATFTMAVFSILLPIIIIILSIVVTLAIRLGLLFALILASPLAFAAYVLPNTEKYFRKWWELTQEVLLIYPIVVVLFALSAVIAQTNIWSNNANGGATSWFSWLISLIFLAIPLAAIPFAFKLAGGLLGRIHELAHGGMQRGHARFAGDEKDPNSARNKARADWNRAKQNSQNARSRWIGESAVGRKLRSNRVVGGFAERRYQLADQRSRMMAADMERDPRALAIKDDEEALRAQTMGTDASSAKAGLVDYYMNHGKVRSRLDKGEITREQALAEASTAADRAVASAKAANGFGQAQGINAAQRLIDTGTAFEEGDIESVAKMIARVSDGHMSTLSGLTGYINATTKAKGRHDLAPSFGTLQTLAMGEAGIAGGDRSEKMYDTAKTNAWNSASLYQHANDKASNIKAHIAHFEKQLNSGDNQSKQDALVFFRELEAMRPNASGDVANHINAALQANQARISEVRGEPAYRRDPSTGGDVPVVVERQVQAPIPADPTRVVTERAAPNKDAYTRQRVREYQRPDPNNV